eukprot:gene53582-46805_t
MPCGADAARERDPCAELWQGGEGAAWRDGWRSGAPALGGGDAACRPRGGAVPAVAAPADAAARPRAHAPPNAECAAKLRLSPYYYAHLAGISHDEMCRRLSGRDGQVGGVQLAYGAPPSPPRLPQRTPPAPPPAAANPLSHHAGLASRALGRELAFLRRRAPQGHRS